MEIAYFIDQLQHPHELTVMGQWDHQHGASFKIKLFVPFGIVLEIAIIFCQFFFRIDILYVEWVPGGSDKTCQVVG